MTPLQQQIIDAFHEDITQVELSKRLGCAASLVSTTWSAHFTVEERYRRKQVHYQRSRLGDKNPNFGNKGELAHQWKGITPDCKGYLLAYKPSWYTGRKKSKHVFHHNLVICEALGITEIPKGWCVHHIDGDKMNNKLNNLALLTTPAHSRLHHPLK